MSISLKVQIETLRTQAETRLKELEPLIESLIRERDELYEVVGSPKPKRARHSVAHEKRPPEMTENERAVLERMRAGAVSESHEGHWTMKGYRAHLPEIGLKELAKALKLLEARGAILHPKRDAYTLPAESGA
jgi:hypothetical protein